MGDYGLGSPPSEEVYDSEGIFVVVDERACVDTISYCEYVNMVFHLLDVLYLVLFERCYGLQFSQPCRL